jgi:hypothetical protein
MQKNKETQDKIILEKKLKSCYENNFRQGTYKALYQNASKMLNNAKIANNIADAICLRKGLDKIINEPTPELFGMANILHHKFYQHIVDDIILMSSFEMYAKACLLKKQYIVHVIEKPNKFKKEQKNFPVHLKTLLAQKAKGEVWKLSNNTIPVSLLLKDKYFEKITKRSELKGVLEELNRRRNLLHYNVASSFSLEMKMLLEIEYLKKLINSNA